MRLLIISEDRFQIVAELDGAEACGFVEELTSFSQLALSAGMFALFDLYAECGTEKLSSKQFHEAGGGIYRFAKGKLRVYCFIDEGNLIVCSHSSLKKSQKTSGKDLSRANNLKQRYLEAKSASVIKLVSEEDLNE